MCLAAWRNALMGASRNIAIRPNANVCVAGIRLNAAGGDAPVAGGACHGHDP
jgi:hypothetical protein